MNKYRSKIEQLKEEVRATFENDILRYKRAITREIDSLWRSYNSKTSLASVDDFAQFVFNFLKVPVQYRNEILADLRYTQFEINNVWNSYFKNTLSESYKPIDYEKLIASHKVDFPSIDKNVRDTVVKAFRESVRKNYSFETVRSELQKTTMGTHEIYTLANTSVSMFDNSAMFEFALQAGINEFKYDGVLQPNSRIFCVQNFGKIFNYKEILEMDNGQGVSVVSSCGGYNCHHFWTAKVK